MNPNDDINDNNENDDGQNFRNIMKMRVGMKN